MVLWWVCDTNQGSGSPCGDYRWANHSAFMPTCCFLWQRERLRQSSEDVWLVPVLFPSLLFSSHQCNCLALPCLALNQGYTAAEQVESKFVLATYYIFTTCQYPCDVFIHGRWRWSIYKKLKALQHPASPKSGSRSEYFLWCKRSVNEERRGEESSCSDGSH